MAHSQDSRGEEPAWPLCLIPMKARPGSIFWEASHSQIGGAGPATQDWVFLCILCGKSSSHKITLLRLLPAPWLLGHGEILPLSDEVSVEYWSSFFLPLHGLLNTVCREVTVSGWGLDLGHQPSPSTAALRLPHLAWLQNLTWAREKHTWESPQLTF